VNLFVQHYSEECWGTVKGADNKGLQKKKNAIVFGGAVQRKVPTLFIKYADTIP